MRIITTIALMVLSLVTLADEDVIIHQAPPSEVIQSTDVFLLTSLFTRKITTWSTTGESIIVFIRPLNSIEHRTFVLDWLGLTNYRYKKLLQQNTFSGIATNVKTIRSDEQMLLLIQTTPNSIGYISNYMVLNNDSNITIITIN